MGYIIRKMKSCKLSKYNNICDMKDQSRRTEFWKDQIEKGNRITYVCIQNDNFLGEGSLMKRVKDSDYTIEGKRIYLSRMVVKEGNRNLVIGSKILQELFYYAVKEGYSEMSVGIDLDNIGARRLYGRNGFNTIICEDEDDAGKFIKLVKYL